MIDYFNAEKVGPLNLAKEIATQDLRSVDNQFIQARVCLLSELVPTMEKMLKDLNPQGKQAFVGEMSQIFERFGCNKDTHKLLYAVLPETVSHSIALTDGQAMLSMIFTIRCIAVLK